MRLLTSVSQASPIAASPGGSCFQLACSRRRPPQRVSCSDVWSRTGYKYAVFTFYQFMYYDLLARLICQQHPFDLSAQSIAHHNAFDAIDLIAALEEDQRGNAIDIPFTGQLFLAFYIHPRKGYPILVL